MADGTHINWTDATWQIVTGCDVLSPGCTNCYAMRLAGTRLKHHPSRKGLTDTTKTGPVWNGEVRFNEQWLDQPLRWQKPRMIFVAAHGDLFYEKVPLEWIIKVLAVGAHCPRHTLQILTKRAERMGDVLSDPETQGRIRDFLNDQGPGMGLTDQQIVAACNRVSNQWPLSNVWPGFSAEDQKHFDERWAHVKQLAWAGWLTWLSAEPLLGPIDATAALYSHSREYHDKYGHCTCKQRLRWMVAGGESAQNKPGRPMHPDWPRKLRDDCVAAGVPFNFKQWGDWAPGECVGAPVTRTEQTASWWNGRWDFGRLTPRESEEQHRADEPDLYRVGKHRAGNVLDGRQWLQFPAPAGIAAARADA